MAEEVKMQDKVPTKGKRCELCAGAIGDDDHKDGECGFRKRIEQGATAANGGVTVWA